MDGRVIADYKRELLLFAAIVLLAMVLRIGWPTMTEFKFSEARLVALALEATRNGRLPLVGVPSSAGFDHSPLSVYLYTPAVLFSTSPIPATIYGGLVGGTAVALCWWLARRWSGGGLWAALVSGLLFAVSPWSVAFSRKIWQVTFVPLLALAFVGLAVSALVEQPSLDAMQSLALKRAAPRRARMQSWNLASMLVVYAILVQVHPSAVSLVPALVLWLVIFWRRVRLGPLLLGGMLGLSTAAPFLLHQVQTDWPAVAALKALPVASWDLSAVRLAWAAATGHDIHALAGMAYPLLRFVPQLGSVFHLVGWLTLAAGAGLACRLVASWRAPQLDVRRSAQTDLILLSWLLMPVILNLRHSLDLHLHFFAVMTPAAYLIIGRGTEALFGARTMEAPTASTVGDPRFLRVAKPGGLAGLLLLAAAQVAALVLMARFVTTHDTPGGFGKPLKDYLKISKAAVGMAQEARAAELLVVGCGDSPVVDESPALFDILLRGRIAYRFVDGGSAALFPPHRTLALITPEAGEAARWYEGWPSRVLRDGYRAVILDGSWPTEGLELVPTPRVFENGVELQGYAWEGSSKPAEEGEFWLLWQVLWTSPQDTHFYVHLETEDGNRWGQRDNAGYPTAYRRKGDRVISLFDITVSPEAPWGPYRARVGLYVFPEVANVPVIDGAGTPVADAVRLDRPAQSP